MSKRNPTGGQELFDLLRSRTIVDANGCWIWQRGYHSNNPPHGQHGVVNIHGRHVQAHRAMWIAVHGSIPDGMYVLHRCDVPKCLNPDHLWIGTHQDNMADALAKGRHDANRKRAQTHCKRGHEFTPENTGIGGTGGRCCLTCIRAADLRRWHAKRKLEKARDKETGI